MVGANAKWISQSLSGGDVDLYNYGSWGYGFDAGALIRLPDFNALFGLENFGSLSFGINLQDISKTTLTWNTLSAPKESIPANWNIGVAYANNRVFNRELILSYQWQQRYGGQIHLGIEYQISNAVGFTDRVPRQPSDKRHRYPTSPVSPRLRAPLRRHN